MITITAVELTPQVVTTGEAVYVRVAISHEFDWNRVREMRWKQLKPMNWGALKGEN